VDVSGRAQAPGREKATKIALRREIKEELRNSKLGRIWLWKEVKIKNRRSGRKMSDAIFVTAKASVALSSATNRKSTRQLGAKAALAFV